VEPVVLLAHRAEWSTFAYDAPVRSRALVLGVLAVACGGASPPAQSSADTANERPDPPPEDETSAGSELVETTIRVFGNGICAESRVPECFQLADAECREGIRQHTLRCWAQFAEENRVPAGDGEEAVRAWVGQLFDCTMGSFLGALERSGREVPGCADAPQEPPAH
jgi:hypothetical protein